MKNYTEIDQLFGPPVAMTTKGKFINTSPAIYIAGGMLLLAAVMGALSITKSFYPITKKPEDKK